MLLPPNYEMKSSMFYSLLCLSSSICILTLTFTTTTTNRRRRFDTRLAIEEANDAFYQAFESGSYKAMAAVWGEGEHVQCIHPGSGCIAGSEAVLESWKVILGSARVKIQLHDVRIYATETEGYVTCVEVMDAGDSKGKIVATNVFERQQGGGWKIVHHHGSRLPGLRG